MATTSPYTPTGVTRMAEKSDVTGYLDSFRPFIFSNTIPSVPRASLCSSLVFLKFRHAYITQRCTQARFLFL